MKYDDVWYGPNEALREFYDRPSEELWGAGVADGHGARLFKEFGLNTCNKELCSLLANHSKFLTKIFFLNSRILEPIIIEKSIRPGW